MAEYNFDVVVVGGGPGGGQTARNLAKRGLRVLLVERYKSFSENNFSSAGMTLEPMTEFDLPDSVVGAYWNTLEIQCTKQKYSWSSEKTEGVVLDFARLRQFLADDAVKHGAQVWLGHKYVSKKVDPTGVELTLFDNTTAQTKKVRCKLAVDATGPLRKVMYDEKDEQPLMYLGSGTEYVIKVNQEIYDQYKDKLVFFLGHKWALKGYSWIFPMENCILKVGAGKTHLKSKDQEQTDKTTRKLTEKIIETYLGAESYTILDKHGGIIRYSNGLKDKFFYNKVVGVGDAVSAINPRGGEGIRYAMQSADLACIYIYSYITTGKADFAAYRRKWRRRKLIKWRLSEESGRRMYSRYTDEQIENRVHFFHKNFSFNDMVQSLFNFKYNKIFVRTFAFLGTKLWYKLQGKKF